MKKIGFVGLGNMGAKMVINLLKAKYEVFGYDVNTKSIDKLLPHGLKSVSTLNKIPRDIDVLITMLPNGKIVEEVYDSIGNDFKPNMLFADCSTINVSKSIQLHEKCKKRNILSLDAPVSGGVVGAEKGTLTFMVGGTAEAYNVMLPLFKVMGNKSVLCGLASSGQAAKACNNMLLAITMIGVGEAFNLGSKLGLDTQNLFEILSTSSGSCWAINTYCPIQNVGPNSPADNNFQPGFSANLMLKDLTIAVDAIKSTRSLASFGEKAQERFQSMIDRGKGDLDFSAIINLDD
ncbi:3-hydroxyisobutyrate dehydrogenase [Alphaproteobacteria bacterium]|nr:3-hydroxyisobutyrate dehydrogenase [Alphaproteobacteria bacterium]